MRLIPGLVVILIAAALVVVGISLTRSSATLISPKAVDVSSQLSAAKANFDLNNASSASAVQQQVVNGWYSNQLMTVMINAVAESNKGNEAIVAGQQKVLDSNRNLSLVIVVSIGILLAALGAYFMLSKALRTD
jgi:hypothetical protein